MAIYKMDVILCERHRKKSKRKYEFTRWKQLQYSIVCGNKRSIDWLMDCFGFLARAWWFRRCFRLKFPICVAKILYVYTFHNSSQNSRLSIPLKRKNLLLSPYGWLVFIYNSTDTFTQRRYDVQTQTKSHYNVLLTSKQRLCVNWDQRSD